MNRNAMMGALLLRLVLGNCISHGAPAAPTGDQTNFAVSRSQALRGTLGTYGRAPRLPNGRVDLDRLVAELVDVHANSYGMPIHNGTNDWEDLQLFLPLARAHGIRVWASIMPPSESPPHQPLYSEPFRMDYDRWAVELARLSLRETNLVAWTLDDFTTNLRFFTAERVAAMLAAGRAVNPRLAFAPCCYYKGITPAFAKNYRPLLDGIKFPCRDESGGANLTNSASVDAEVKKIKQLLGPNFPVVLVPYATAHSHLGRSTPEYVEQVMRAGKNSADGLMIYCHQDPKLFPEKYQLIKKLFASWDSDRQPPVIPVGLDAYRLWDRWPYQRIGARAYMRSTYDRSGGNEGADASHFLYQLSDSNNIALDVEGAGVLYFARYNHWHGGPWHYVVDGTDHLIQETSTADPTKPVPDSVFLPADAFPPPLAVTWSATKGADLSWVPIPFERSFRMAYSRTHYGTGYYIYQQYVGGATLSQPIRTWDAQPPDREVLQLIESAGTDLAPSNSILEAGSLERLVQRESKTLLLLTNAPATIRKLSFSVPLDQAEAFGRAWLRITWDDRKEPSVHTPVALFFGAGTLYNREQREYLVKAFPSYIRHGAQNVELACFFPMPFFKSARIELIGAPDETVTGAAWNVSYQPLKEPPSDVGYFHATYRDHPRPDPGKDLVLLDTRETEGGGDWSGSFVGTSFIFSDRAVLNTLEGDPRFFFDDSQTPQAYGTGTEEWGGGGDYWGGRNMTLPFAGHPVGARNDKEAKNEQDKIESAYRFLLADLMPFGKNAVIRLEHGGRDDSFEHYQTVTYWYGAPAPSLVKTDELKIGDPASEKAHQYFSPQASAPYEISSRYEWGVDADAGGALVYPPHSDTGRKTTGRSEFTLELNPKNFGVLLRRKLDYAYPNQRAEVFVANGGAQPAESDWKSAGVWYLAGANTCVYSNPKNELGATEHKVETSNRRFRDDEFLVPGNLTQGRASIRVRVRFTPVNLPLFPGHPSAEPAWSEIRYDTYCFVLPEWQP